jgi:CheY-like chemotaxis protein
MSLSILLVDDLEVNRKVGSLMLKKLGYKANLAKNGIEAIDSLKRKCYDIVFMDIEMPEMDGLEATKIIRQQMHSWPKIIALTALHNSRDICLDAGADDFLTKPISIEMLKNAIECNMPVSSFSLNDSEEMAVTCE